MISRVRAKATQPFVYTEPALAPTPGLRRPREVQTKRFFSSIKTTQRLGHPPIAGLAKGSAVHSPCDRRHQCTSGTIFELMTTPGTENSSAAGCSTILPFLLMRSPLIHPSILHQVDRSCSARRGIAYFHLVPGVQVALTMPIP
jgi:hypothetical protein